MAEFINDHWARRRAAIAVLFGLLSVDLAPDRFSHVAAGRWIVFGALALAGVGALRTLPLHGAAELLLIAAFGWVLVVAPLSPTPVRSTVVAAALVGTAAVGVWIGRNLAWGQVESAAIASSTVVLAIALLLGERGSLDGRWMGLSEEANALGTLAAMAVVLGAGALVRKRVLAIPSVVLGGVVLYQTAAAVPALAAALGAAFTLRPLLARLSPTLPRNVVAALGTVAVAGVPLVASGSIDVSVSGAESVTTLNNRTGIWSFLFEHIRERPLTGYGPWGAGDVLNLAPFDPRVSWGPTHGHNAFVELATMGGLPAAGLFLAAVGVLAWALVRSGHPAGAVAVTLLVMSMTEHLVATPSLGLIMIGTIVGASQATDDPSGDADQATADSLVAGELAS